VTPRASIVGLLGLLVAVSPIAVGAAGADIQAPKAATCNSSQLRLSATFYGAAAGQFLETLTFTNISHRACAMSGWPTIEVEDAAQHPVSMRVQRVVQGSSVAHPYRALIIRPSQRGSFNVYGPDFDARSGRTCASISALRVSPPGARRPIPVKVKLPLCGLGYYVSPLIAGGEDHIAWTFVWHK
jgi:hypothetical protein